MGLEKELELIKKVQLGHDAWRELCQDNEKFVLSIARRYTRDEKLLNELVEAGNKGLLKAAIRYDVTRGFKFISYAVWFIRTAIEKAVAEKVSKDDFALIQSSIEIKDVEVQILNAYFYGELSMEELPKQLNLTPERINQILKKHC